MWLSPILIVTSALNLMASTPSLDCGAGLTNHQRTQIRQKIHRLFTVGLDEDDNTVGYLGTSLEALGIALQTGFLPAATKHVFGKDSSDQGLVFNGVSAQIRHLQYLKEISHSNAIDSSKVFAEMHGESHRLLALLNIPWSQEMTLTAEELFIASLPLKKDRTFKAYLQMDHIAESVSILRKVRVFNDEELRNAILTAQKRKGIVIGIKKIVLDKYKIEDLHPEKGFFLDTGSKGLPIEDMSGIEPLGQEEWDFLEGLKN
jgi:hypothetical protein